MLVRPVIPDNDQSWQVFESDEHIASFIQHSGEFVDQLQPKIAEAYEGQIMQLKSNKLPKGLVTLENFFDCNNARNDKRKFVAEKGDYENLRVSDDRNLRVGKDVS